MPWTAGASSVTDVAQKAIAQVNGMPFEGKRLVVRLADQDKDKGITSSPSDNLYIANLPSRPPRRGGGVLGMLCRIRVTQTMHK